MRSSGGTSVAWTIAGAARVAAARRSRQCRRQRLRVLAACDRFHHAILHRGERARVVRDHRRRDVQAALARQQELLRLEQMSGVMAVEQAHVGMRHRPRQDGRVPRERARGRGRAEDVVAEEDRSRRDGLAVDGQHVGGEVPRQDRMRLAAGEHAHVRRALLFEFCEQRMKIQIGVASGDENRPRTSRTDSRLRSRCRRSALPLHRRRAWSASRAASSSFPHEPRRC